MSRTAGAAFAALISLAAWPVSAQELEPRAYRALPTGINFVVFAYSYSSGNVLADATVSIENLSATIHTSSLSYLRSFELLGRSASITVSAPYLHMNASGTLDREFLEGSRSAWADARARITVNLLGGPALSPSEFAKFRQGRTFGFGMTVVMPTGQYDSSKVINFGANRWGFKPELGYSSVKGRWILDFAAGAWFFTTNSDGFGGTTKRQDSITSLQAHISYNFRRGIWLAVDGNYFSGGETTLDDGEKSGLQRNSRVGLTLSIPVGGPHSIKLAAQTGAFTRVGADFDVGSIAYQYRWGGAPEPPATRFDPS